MLSFTVLADELAIPCTLVRGEYFRGWNDIWLTKDQGWIFPTDSLRFDHPDGARGICRILQLIDK